MLYQERDLLLHSYFEKKYNKLKINHSSENGYLTLSVLIGLGILGFFLGVLINIQHYHIEMHKKIREKMDLVDLSYIIADNISCIETRMKSNTAVCSGGPVPIDIYSKSGNKIIDQSGTTIYKYQVSANCTENFNLIEFEISYRKDISHAWKSINSFTCPINQENEFCPLNFYNQQTGMNLIESESFVDLPNGKVRCTYIHGWDDCPVDDEVWGMMTNPHREIWFDMKDSSRYVSGVRVLDCFYDIRCNNPSKSASTPPNSCWP